MEAVFVVLDTESSLCLRTRTRRLVSVAYEAVGVDLGSGRPTGPVPRAAVHEVVRFTAEDIAADAASEAVHGLTAAASQDNPAARPLRAVLARLRRFVDHFQPRALVGHDVGGDLCLLLAEFRRAGLPDPGRLRSTPLFCTKLALVGHCRLPLPVHLRYVYPCDLVLHRLNGSTPPALPGPLWKWPSLQDARRLLLPASDGGEAAHDAAVDTARCREVFLCSLPLLLHGKAREEAEEPSDLLHRVDAAAVPGVEDAQ